MSDDKDCAPEGSVEMNTLSMSTSQPSCFDNNDKDETTSSLISMPLNVPSTSFNQQTPESDSALTNSILNDVIAQSRNMNINDHTAEGPPSKSKPSKRKNAKKKEKLKKLKIPNAITEPAELRIAGLTKPNANTESAELLTVGLTKLNVNTKRAGLRSAGLTNPNANTEPAELRTGGLTNAVQDFFKSQVCYMQACNNTRYLENVSYHPQYQYKGAVNYVSTPTSPYLPMLQPYASTSVPNTPFVSNEPSSRRFIQNALQHPLLSHSLSVDSHEGRHNANTGRRQVSHQSVHPFLDERPKKYSPRRVDNSNKKEQTNDKKNFEPHLTAEEIEAGLKNNLFLEGVLRINPKQFQHAYVSGSDRSEQDVLIDGIRHRNRALEGDIVVVQLIPNCEVEDNAENKQKKGKVVYIKEKVHTRTCIGTLKLMPDKNKQKALFVPRDHRVPRLNIPFTSWPDNFYADAKNYENTLFLAKIIEWSDTRFAIGKIECNIGQSGELISETRAILAQNNLDITPYGPEVRHLFPRLDYVIPNEELEIREDCRKLCTFSIDPSNCRDIDDAVSCLKLENGNYEIGVHISDVAHFLTENTILDEKVAEKATTIYLVERAYHMLPDELCMLCSLFPGVDKLAFSVFWEITEKAEVLSHRFTKTVINSCSQLAYDHAQAVLEDRANAKDVFPEIHNDFKYEDIYESIKTLGKISSILRTNRFSSGALRIDQPKLAFHLNASNGLPDTFWIYESKESHQLIEEFMLLANMTVAKRIYDDHPTLAFLRCHPPPSPYMLNQLAKALQPMDIELDISSAGHLHRSLLPYVGPNCEDKGKAMVLNMLCAKPMTRAKYFCASGCDDDDFHHYALNVPLYTHFTSPIRRYADIMVHRLLAASLKYRDVPKWEVDKVRMIAAQCNKQKYNAKKAGEMSTELYTLKYIEMHSPVTTEAVVVEVRDKYIDVIVVCMGLNRRIYFNNDFPGEYNCIKNDACVKLSKMELKWRESGDMPEVNQVIEVFSILQVELYRDDDMVKVETRLVRPH